MSPNIICVTELIMVFCLILYFFGLVQVSTLYYAVIWSSHFQVFFKSLIIVPPEIKLYNSLESHSSLEMRSHSSMDVYVS